MIKEAIQNAAEEGNNEMPTITVPEGVDPKLFEGIDSSRLGVIIEIPPGRHLKKENNVRMAFMQFLARYGRSYASKSDMDERFAIFSGNYA